MKIFNKKQGGFTLVELVVVVAVVGVLAVVATPKIIGVATDAQKASATGVAGALTAASSRNYATRSANETAGEPITSCDTAHLALEDGALPAGYSIIDTDGGTAANATVLPGIKSTCTLSTDNTTPILTAFTVVGTVPEPVVAPAVTPTQDP